MPLQLVSHKSKMMFRLIFKFLRLILKSSYPLFNGHIYPLHLVAFLFSACLSRIALQRNSICWIRRSPALLDIQWITFNLIGCLTREKNVEWISIKATFYSFSVQKRNIAAFCIFISTKTYAQNWQWRKSKIKKHSTSLCSTESRLNFIRRSYMCGIC